MFRTQASLRQPPLNHIGLALAAALMLVAPASSEQAAEPRPMTFLLDDDDGPGGGGFRDDDGPDDDDRGGSGDDGDDGIRGGNDDDDDRDDDGDDDDDDGRRFGSGSEIVVDGYRARRGQVIAIAPSASALGLYRRLGFNVVRRVALTPLGVDAVVLAVPRRTSTPAALRLLRRRDPGTRFDYNHLYDFKPAAATAMPLRPGVEIVERRTLSSRKDIAIGLIDTGVDTRHPALTGAAIEQRLFHRPKAGARADHGTAIASVLVDRRDGLLPNAKLHVAGVFANSPKGDVVASVAEIAQALGWLVERDVAVISMSLAGPPNALLATAVEQAQARGHVVTAAVGNAGPAARPLYPAAYPGVVGVTATDLRNNVFRRAGRGPHVDFAAPGVNVRGASGGGGTSLYSGTSFAAPFAAAVIALGHNRPDPKTAASRVGDLMKTAKDLGTPGRDDIFGHGLIAER
jgi:subtilisin family serine protease